MIREFDIGILVPSALGYGETLENRPRHHADDQIGALKPLAAEDDFAEGAADDAALPSYDLRPISSS